MKIAHKMMHDSLTKAYNILIGHLSAMPHNKTSIMS